MSTSGSAGEEAKPVATWNCGCETLKSGRDCGTVREKKRSCRFSEV